MELTFLMMPVEAGSLSASRPGEERIRIVNQTKGQEGLSWRIAVMSMSAFC
jgi:hypothetical protein